MEEYAIGIDLGTTFSCVAVHREERVEMCLNPNGKNTTPSYVCFKKKDRLIGNPAKQVSVECIESTIFDAKRLIGRSYDDDDIQEDRKHWPFDVIEENMRLKIQIIVNGEKKSFFPEEISGMILSRLKEDAEEWLGKEVKSAVITVPANFNDAQRQATIMAGSLAGLNVLRIVNEPTAAAFAFGLNKNDSIKRNILVFDFGGGTFDVSILNLHNSKIQVIGTDGNNKLGGNDFDTRIVNYALKDFSRNYNKNLEKNLGSDAKRAVRRLRNACEGVKITLSSTDTANILIDCLYENIDLCCTLSRARFEVLSRDLFQNAMEIVDRCITKANIDTKAKNFEIVLVGGSTRIPKIRNLIEKRFPGVKINKNVNPDEAVASGAAILAKQILNDTEKKVIDKDLIDVTPLSLGVRGKGGIMSVIIEKNTAIPAKKTKIYSTTVDDQTSMSIKVYEGERHYVKDNNLLGEFELMNLPKGESGIVRIEVTFTVDINNILVVTALEKTTDNKQTIAIVNSRNGINQEEINRIIEEAAAYKVMDNKRKEEKFTLAVFG